MAPHDLLPRRRQVLDLPQAQHNLCWLLSCIASPVREATGVLREEIGLNEGALDVRSNNQRPLDNRCRDRDRLIIQSFVGKLEECLL